MAISPKRPNIANGRVIERAHILLFLLSAAVLLLLWQNFAQNRELGPLDESIPKAIKAVAVLRGNSSVHGHVWFEQPAVGHVRVYGTVKGLDESVLRGFHIHTYGDLTNDCDSTGSHYNPFNNDHGAPEDKERHVGDLGNIASNDDGVATFDVKDYQISLRGPFSVLGRAVVVHTGTDDLGKEDNEGSRTTGNAGGRAACGVIGLTPV